MNDESFWSHLWREIAASTALMLAFWGALGGATNALTTRMALREALRGHEHEDWAVEEVQKLPPDIVSEPDELQGILRTERREQLKRRMDAALAGGDMARYQALLRELAEPPPSAPA